MNHIINTHISTILRNRLGNYAYIVLNILCILSISKTILVFVNMVLIWYNMVRPDHT